ncbi:unknown [Acidaminococcus sp. CAG:917]|nr:unknown [Acidaminococcus sp. CAG:917]
MSRSSGGVSIGAALVVALVAICLILGIVGLTLDEFTYYGNEDNKIATSFESYSDTAQKLHENEIEDDSLMTPMVAFAYLSIVASALVFVLAILGLFFRGRFFSIVIGIVGVLTIVVGVVFLVLCIKFCQEGSVNILWATIESKMGVGAILLSAGVLGAGVFGTSRLFARS